MGQNFTGLNFCVFSFKQKLSTRKKSSYNAKNPAIAHTMYNYWYRRPSWHAHVVSVYLPLPVMHNFPPEPTITQSE